MFAKKCGGSVCRATSLRTPGLPHQLYIREGRRMVSDLVLTEHHTFGWQIAENPFSLGSYRHGIRTKFAAS